MKDLERNAGMAAEETGKAPEGSERAGENRSGQDGTQTTVSETWAEDTIADLDDFIESQGIYIRQ